MLWGKATWYFFHSLIEKTNDDLFSKNRIEIINLCKIILTNLPCPICRKHANDYIIKNPIYGNKNKNELKLYFWKFHNFVNKRLNKKQFEEDSLKMYERDNFINICIYFFRCFCMKYGGRGLGIDIHIMIRRDLIQTIKSWLIENRKEYNI